MMAWVSYLRINHPALYQQFLAEEDAVYQEPMGTRFIAHNAVLAKWARKASQLAYGS